MSNHWMHTRVQGGQRHVVRWVLEARHVQQQDHVAPSKVASHRTEVAVTCTA